MIQDKSGTTAYHSTCDRCGMGIGDVRLVEHGNDDMPLCKGCFREIQRELEAR